MDLIVILVVSVFTLVVPIAVLVVFPVEDKDFGASAAVLVFVSGLPAFVFEESTFVSDVTIAAVLVFLMKDLDSWVLLVVPGVLTFVLRVLIVVLYDFSAENVVVSTTVI